MNPKSRCPAGEESDAELLAAWLDDDHEDTGETFIAVYTRYRDAVREEMERAGLPPLEAENRVGSVFLRAQDAPIANETPLYERLMAAARAVAIDPDWTPPL